MEGPSMADGAEIELKLHIPAASWRSVETFVRGRGAGAEQIDLHAAYFDTPDGRLAAERIAWRVRRENDSWVQTLKGHVADDDGMTRHEHEVAVPRSAVKRPDPGRHAGTPIGERLIALLADATHDAAPTERFHTEITRLARTARTAGGTVQYALDRGAVVSGDGRARHEISELEIELVSGSPTAVLRAARAAATRHGLWIDTVNKARHGGIVSSGSTTAPVARATMPALHKTMSAEHATRTMMRACLVHVLDNTSVIAHGFDGPEHAHQARVGLRRLRTVIRVFGDLLTDLDPTWEPRLADAFTALGAARDRHVALERWAAPLAKVGAPDVRLPEAEVDLGAIFRGVDWTLLVLDLLDAVHAGSPLDDEPGALRVKPVVGDRLDGLRRAALRAPKSFAGREPDEQHTIRKRVKRLRDISELTASLYKPARVRRFVKSLPPALDALGTLQDLDAACAIYESLAVEDPDALFAVGWFRGRRPAVVKECIAPLRTAANADPHWR